MDVDCGVGQDKFFWDLNLKTPPRSLGSLLEHIYILGQTLGWTLKIETPKILAGLSVESDSIIIINVTLNYLLSFSSGISLFPLDYIILKNLLRFSHVLTPKFVFIPKYLFGLLCRERSSGSSSAALDT